MVKSLMFTKKHLMQSLLKKLQIMGGDFPRDEQFELFKPILQFFLLILDLCKNYSHYFSNSSPFYSCLNSLKYTINNNSIGEEVFKNHAVVLAGLKFSFFENSRVSKYLMGIFNVSFFLSFYILNYDQNK